MVTIYTTRVPDPKYVGTANDGEETDAPVPSDIRRIVYWISESGGLCRQEIPWVTGEDVYNVEGPVIEADKTERDYVIAPEVIALSFEYYDINSTTDDGGWVTEWDGRTAGPDMLTPMGPPTAIRVSFTIKFKNARGEDSTKDYRHVIPILTASGPSSTGEAPEPGRFRHDFRHDDGNDNNPSDDDPNHDTNRPLTQCAISFPATGIRVTLPVRQRLGAATFLSPS